jgi:hypothetical protein
MGGAANAASATITQPYAKPDMFFTAPNDTVSGEVILRGYVEDDQRIGGVSLKFDNTTVPILEPGSDANSPDDSAKLLKATTDAANRVALYETIDLNRHRVEWAYLWNTETAPSNVVVGNVTVQAIAYAANASNAKKDDIKTNSDLITYADAISTANNSQTGKPNNETYDIYNSNFDAAMPRYNQMSFNLRPYITGFVRNTASNNTRSRQGRYMFYRGEAVVVKGFNLSGGNATNPVIRLQGTGTTSGTAAGNLLTTSEVTTPGIYGLDTMPASRYQQFTVPADEETGNGVVMYRVGSDTNYQYAVNTYNGTAEADGENRTERKIIAAVSTKQEQSTLLASIRPAYILPWNIEYSPGTEGSELWDDFVQVHIWQSDDVITDSDRGRFNKGANLSVFDPSMSIDPATGTLWESHNEGGGNGWNTGSTKVSSNAGDAWDTRNNQSESPAIVAGFIDPIINSDIYISTQPSGKSASNNDNKYTVWTVYSNTGRSGQTGSWHNYGGIFISGPEGGNTGLDPGSGGGQVSVATNNGFGTVATVAARSQYIVESTGYNAGTDTTGNINWPPGNKSDPPSRKQFNNPHIVTWYGEGTYKTGTVDDTAVNSEHIHVSYYDNKDKSLKYRYNRRGRPGNMGSTGDQGNLNMNQIRDRNNQHYAWTNLDGGFDPDDENAFNAANNDSWVTSNNITGFGSYSGDNGGWYMSPFDTFTGAIAKNGRVRQADSTYTTERSTDAGEHNSIAVTKNGFPVIAYYDRQHNQLRIAISDATVPIAASHWATQYVFPDSGTGVQTGTGVQNKTGTGEYVSMKIDTQTGTENPDVVHIAALNSNTKNLVYITGTISGKVFTFTKAQVVDSVGSVGQWCALSLDSNGSPWISYLDEGYKNLRDGVKMAYYNPNVFYKGGYTFSGQDKDINGTAINGWEAMHVPTKFKVESARLGMECYPTRNYTGTTADKSWGGAVGYLGQDYYRIAYYVK